MENLEALKRSWSDIQKAGLPPELYEAAFSEGIRYYSKSDVVDRAAVPTEAASIASPPRASRMAIAGDATERLSKETGVSRETLDELLYFDADGAPGINGGPRRLGKSNAERTRTIALLLAGARHFANDELEIPLEQVREVVQQFGVYDTNNFAYHVSSVPGFTLSGPKSNRVLRAKSDAAAKFKQRVAEVMGAGNGE